MTKPFPNIIFYLALIACLSISGVASAQVKVRVMVMDDLPGITLSIPDDYEVKDRTGADMVGTGAGAHKIVLDGSTEGVRVVAEDSVVNVNKFALSGIIEIRKNGKGLYRIINELGIEDYTRAVAGEEMPSSWPEEALKAQAVIARTYALYKKTAATADGYDLCATVDSQVFTGDAKAKEGPTAAARATEGEVLSMGGRPIEALYHSSCGGSTEDASDVWDRRYPYLVSRECQCWKESPYKSWNRKISLDAVGKAMRKAGYEVSGVTGVKVSKRSGTGRARLVSVEADSGSITLKGNEFRRVVGYSALPSTDFYAIRSGGVIEFSGKGSGHGVGLCQWGAKVMADEGKTYREILEYYYPGTQIGLISSGEGR